jgi:hypothetical protein
MKFIFAVVLQLAVLSSMGQQKNYWKGDVDIAFGKGNANFSPHASYNWLLGKKQKFFVGLGLRFNSFFGSNANFTTAIPELTRNKTGLGAFFAKKLPENIDTVNAVTGTIFSLNAAVNFGYQINSQWSVEFNIDLAGLSFGSMQGGSYISNGQSTAVTVKPTTGNALLVGDNDLGSLNSALFVRYQFDPKWSAKLGMQLMHSEYTTDRKVQNLNGLSNDRFRNEATNIMFGVGYRF